MAIRTKNRKGLGVLFSILVSIQSAPFAMAEDKDLAQARFLYQNAQKAEAIALCTKNISVGKNVAQWHEMLARACTVNNGDKSRAAQEIKTALQLAPHDENVVATAGLILAGSENNFIVPKILEAIKAHPQNGRLHAALAACYDASHDPLAEKEIKNAIKLAPLDYDVNFEAVDHYAKLQKQDELDKAYARLLQGSPRSSIAYTSSGVYKRDNYRFTEASHDLQKAVELNPKYEYACSMLGKALKKSRNLPEAIKVYTVMLKTGGPNASTFGRRANCYALIKETEKAIKDYDQAIKIYGGGTNFLPQKPTDVLNKADRLDYNKYWLERVECREKLGQIDQSISELTSYISGVTHPESACEIRQRLYRKKGEYAKALTDLNYLIKKDAFVGERYTDRAEVYNKLGRSAEAREDLKHAQNIEATGSP